MYFINALLLAVQRYCYAELSCMSYVMFICIYLLVLQFSVFATSLKWSCIFVEVTAMTHWRETRRVVCSLFSALILLRPLLTLLSWQIWWVFMSNFIPLIVVIFMILACCGYWHCGSASIPSAVIRMKKSWGPVIYSLAVMSTRPIGNAEVLHQSCFTVKGAAC